MSEEFIAQNRSRPKKDRLRNTAGTCVVDPNKLNLDPDPGFWPNLDPDPGLYNQF